MKSRYAMLSDQTGEVADTAPDETSDDVETMSSATDELASAVQDADDPKDLVAAITEAVDNALTNAREAGDRVDDWVADNCGSEGNTK